MRSKEEKLFLVAKVRVFTNFSLFRCVGTRTGASLFYDADTNQGIVVVAALVVSLICTVGLYMQLLPKRIVRKRKFLSVRS
ncbi:MAG TPA: hypothetical protein PLP23_10415, partial [Panacibacter sp.]|nr:hypothetical protein [Panacibacter sp.]